MKRKKLLIAATAAFTVAAFLAIFLITWFFGATYKDFKDFTAEFKIPGFDEGAAPQGITNYRAEYEVTNEDGSTARKRQEYFFISSYMKEGPSRVYVVGKDTGYGGYVELKNEDGTDYLGHCGGIATNGNFLWISSDDTVYVAKKSSKDYANIAYEIIKKAAANVAADGAENAENAENGENAENAEGAEAEPAEKPDNTVKFTASFAANCNASFLYYFDADAGETASPSSSDRLYVGEFYRRRNYETDKTHRVTTPNGDKNTGFAYEFNVATSTTDSNKTGLSCLSLSDGYKAENGGGVPKIQRIFSIPKEIQGFARTKGGKLVLSQSYALKNSRLYYYDWEKITATSTKDATRRKFNSAEVAGKDFEYAGVYKEYSTGDRSPYRDSSLYVYFADSAKGTLLNEYSIPCMSEGLCVSGERVNVLFESGCYKYKKFVRTVTGEVYSFVPKAKQK